MRHAEKLDDVDHEWAASAARAYDAPITDSGTVHARSVGENLSAEGAHIDVVVCSPFMRCLQTTEFVLDGYDMRQQEKHSSWVPVKVAIDFGLSEVLTERNVPTQPHFLSLPELLKDAPGLASRLLLESDGNYSACSPPHWPETMTAAMARYTETLLRLPQRFPHKNILVVAHGDTVAQFIAVTEKVNKELIYQMPYCAKASARMLYEGGGGHPSFREGMHDDNILILADL